MSDISPLGNGGACETLGTSPNVPATLDNLLREPPKVGFVHVMVETDPPKAQLAAIIYHFHRRVNSLRGRNSRSLVFYKNFMAWNIRHEPVIVSIHLALAFI